MALIIGGKRSVGRPSYGNKKLDTAADRTFSYLKKYLNYEDATKIWMAGQRIANLTERTMFYQQSVLEIENFLLGNLNARSKEYLTYRFPPVPIKEFITSPAYLNKADEIYPTVLAAAEELNNGQYVEAVLTGGIGPIDKSTEFLTHTGWKEIGSWSGEEVAEYNLETGQIEFRLPEKYEVRECSEFLHFKSKYGIDMKLSPEHRFLYRDTKGVLQVRPAKEIARRCLENENGFCGQILTTFKPPNYVGVPLNDSEIRLQVAVQADGSFSEDKSYCKVSLKKERKKVRLRQLLKEVGIPHTESQGNRPEFRSFYFYAPLRTKSFHWAWGCNQLQLQVITDEVNHWDGSFSDGRFATVIKESADFIQYAYSATRRRASISSSPNEGGLGNTHQTLYRVTPSDRIEPSLQGKNLDTVHTVPSEDGMMYCFATQTGFFVARHNGRIFVTGNSGKTTLALYTTAYQLYLLACMRNPHREYNLDQSHEILIIFQSITKQLAKGVDYQRFRSMIEESPFFKKHFPFNEDLTSELTFPNRIIVRPVSGSDTAAIGQNVMGGVIDELNYMAVVERSKIHVDHGTYNQAISVYNSIARRRKSRFLENGRMPGILCLVSSKKYPGQFTDSKMEEAKRDSTIFVYDKRVWDIKPDSFSKGSFLVFTGDMTRKPHIVAKDEQIRESDRELYIPVPIEFQEDFSKDIINALREIAGVSTLARHPFFFETEKVSAAFQKIPSIFNRTPVDFAAIRLVLLKGAFYKPELPRFVHIDLAISGDSAGLAVGTVTGFKDVSTTQPAFMPQFFIDGILEVRPPRNSEILFSKIREVILALRKMGLNIRWATFDQFQSTDSQQILRQQGLTTGQQSIDEVPCKPYDYLKSALYDGRIVIPENQHLLYELLQLEKDTKTGKVDHPPIGSKDCADALAGVVFGLTMRREIWALYKIPLIMVPSSVMAYRDKMAEKAERQADYQDSYEEEQGTPVMSLQ